LEEERDTKKNYEYTVKELTGQLEAEKSSLKDALNQKKDLNESLINLEKQSSDLMENLNAQVNSNNQLKTQYTNLLRVNNQAEKINEEMKETQNSLLIQKDLIENEMTNMRSLYESEKANSLSLFNRVNELEGNLQVVTSENHKLKDKECFNINEVSKFQQLLRQLETEKANLEDQLKNLEQNINQNEMFIDSGEKPSGDLVSDILKRFNEERNRRQLAEERTLELDKQLKLISSDNKYLREDLVKKEKEFGNEIQRYSNLKREFEHELLRRNQDLASSNSEISNLRIKEKHLNKIVVELKEEVSGLREECDRLRKVALDTENTKVKKLHEEIDELKTMNQLYRSQRLESDEEIGSLTRDRDKLRAEFTLARKELENLGLKWEQQRQKIEAEYAVRYVAEQRIVYLEEVVTGQESKLEETSRKYLAEIELVSLGVK